jgi:hypothetical protein
MPRRRPRFHFLGLLARPGKLFVNFLERPLQDFRRYVRLSEWKIPRKDDPENCPAAADHAHGRLVLPDFEELSVEDRARVRRVLAGFDQLTQLPGNTCEQLVADLVIAVWAWRAGIDAEKRGLSNEKEAINIFISNVGHALEQATGVAATRWRKTYDRGDGPDIRAPQSFHFQLIRALGNEFGIPIPKDLMRPTGRASEIRYVMSPAMRAWQDAELVARARRHLDDLAVRLKTCAARGDLRLTTATGLAVLEPETVYENLSPELRLLALGLSSAQT